ncbi:transcriptional regulator [Cyanophage PSS2]|uniref:transcriptional regulator n=1 Tax=Cyanophage PSS2 TaxID=658401 RepID=UPI0001B03FE2|nr:transcriptional regulator [Cyanophage PSS2]YP_003084157.1 transcriptional regulator [Cyanophage PSS2]ACT65574.1 transcriptional regulator [Cyanophage PSS2]ACT65575.1 transcriptional regulator [Cyanophage PSS2]
MTLTAFQMTDSRLRLLAMATLTLTVSGAAMALARQPIPQVPAAAASAPLTPPPPVPQHVALKPLADLVGDVESKSAGGYNAANNGYAMGLGSHGLSKHFGTDCKNISVGQIIKAQQRGWLYAVGRYPYEHLLAGVYDRKKEDVSFEFLLSRYDRADLELEAADGACTSAACLAKAEKLEREGVSSVESTDQHKKD